MQLLNCQAFIDYVISNPSKTAHEHILLFSSDCALPKTKSSGIYHGRLCIVLALLRLSKQTSLQVFGLLHISCLSRPYAKHYVLSGNPYFDRFIAWFEWITPRNLQSSPYRESCIMRVDRIVQKGMDISLNYCGRYNFPKNEQRSHRLCCI